MPITTIWPIIMKDDLTKHDCSVECGTAGNSNRFRLYILCQIICVTTVHSKEQRLQFLILRKHLRRSNYKFFQIASEGSRKQIVNGVNISRMNFDSFPLFTFFQHKSSHNIAKVNFHDSSPWLRSGFSELIDKVIELNDWSCQFNTASTT